MAPSHPSADSSVDACTSVPLSGSHHSRNSLVSAKQEPVPTTVSLVLPHQWPPLPPGPGPGPGLAAGGPWVPALPIISRIRSAPALSWVGRTRPVPDQRGRATGLVLSPASSQPFSNNLHFTDGNTEASGATANSLGNTGTSCKPGSLSLGVLGSSPMHSPPEGVMLDHHSHRLHSPLPGSSTCQSLPFGAVGNTDQSPHSPAGALIYLRYAWRWAEPGMKQ